jgi:hypothetical protein
MTDQKASEVYRKLVCTCVQHYGPRAEERTDPNPSDTALQHSLYYKGLNTVSRGSEMTVEVSIEIRELEEIKAHRASALALVPSALHKLTGAKSYLNMSPVPFALK